MNSIAKKRSVARNSKAREHIVANVLSYKLITLLFIGSFTSNCTAQNQAVELVLGVNRIDYQIGVGYSVQWKAIQLNSSMEVGLTSTLIQGRFNPRMAIGLTYFALRTDLVSIGPSIGYAYSFIQVNKLTSSFHHWHEFMLGYSLEIGRKWRVVHRAMASMINERFQSQLTNSYSNFGFYAQVGVKYYW